MSNTILIIALVPAVLVYVTGRLTGSAIWATLALLIAIWIGVKFGSPIYTVLDVGASLIAYFVFLGQKRKEVDHDSKVKTQQPKTSLEELKSRRMAFMAKYLDNQKKIENLRTDFQRYTSAARDPLLGESARRRAAALAQETSEELKRLGAAP
jgi:hypothetical protein